MGRLIPLGCRDVILDGAKARMRAREIVHPGLRWLLSQEKEWNCIPISRQNQPTRALCFIIIVSITNLSFPLKIHGLNQPWMCQNSAASCSSVIQECIFRSGLVSTKPPFQRPQAPPSAIWFPPRAKKNPITPHFLSLLLTAQQWASLSSLDNV